MTNAAIQQIVPLQVYDEEGNTVVQINKDGSVQFAPGYTPDTASRAFWELIVRRQLEENTAPMASPYAGNTESLCGSIQGLLRLHATGRLQAPHNISENARVLLTAAELRLRAKDGRVQPGG